jgi:hypothetical protein
MKIGQYGVVVAGLDNPPDDANLARNYLLNGNDTIDLLEK